MGNLVFQATLGGQVNLVGPNTASTYNINVPAVAGTLITTGDTGTVSNTMLANSTVTIGSTSVSLGGTATTLDNVNIGTTTPASGKFTSVTDTGLTSNRVTYAGASGVLQDSSNLTFDGTTLTATGNTVISSSGSTDALRITQTGTGNALLVEDSANPDSTPFVIDATGVVVSGNTTAFQQGTTKPYIQIQGTDNSTSGFGIARFSNDADRTRIVLAKSRGSLGSQVIVQSGDVISNINSFGSDGTNWIQATSISSEVDGTPGTNDMPGRLVFSTTADGASSPTERMRIDNAGRVGIGVTPAGGSSGEKLQISQTTTATTTTTAVYAQHNVSATSGSAAYTANTASLVTTSAFAGTGVLVASASGATNQTANTLSDLRLFNSTYTSTGGGVATSISHYQVGATTLTSGTITSQYGFNVPSSFTGATNNYGFYGNLASGTGRYNLYMAGTAANYMAGALGIGASLTQVNFYNTRNISGNSVSYGNYLQATAQSDVTSAVHGYRSNISTAAASFSVGSIYNFYAGQGTIGAGSTVTSQYGFVVDSSLTGATNNYGFYGDIAAGTGRYNFYAAGTAANYFAGDMQFDKTVTAAGTTGAQTINKNAGTVNFAAAATSLVVTDSRVTTSSIIIATVGTNDTTMKSVSVVAGAGSFTLYANVAATAETRVNFLIIN